MLGALDHLLLCYWIKLKGYYMDNNMGKYTKIKYRPLAPHLQIYDTFSKSMTSSLSILHRFTEVVFAVFLILFCIVLSSLAFGSGAYAWVMAIFNSLLGWIFLFGVSVTYFYSIFHVIRYSFFNLGLFLTKRHIFYSGLFVLLATLLSILLFWSCIIFF